MAKLYDCEICGKKHKSRDTIARHRHNPEKYGRKNRTKKDDFAQAPNPSNRTKSDAKAPATKGVTAPVQDSRIIEFDLNPEEKQMTEMINPKSMKKGNAEDPYGCSKCKGTFDRKYPKCPHCGEELDWEGVN